MSERVIFVGRLLAGERMTDLCKEFGISRKTGHKLLRRFECLGADGLLDQPRAPERIPHKTPVEVVQVIVGARHKHPTWGAKKLRWWLAKHQCGVRLPAASTITDILRREGLIKPRKKRRTAARLGGPLRLASAPNQVWCADYKGQFRLRNGRHCFPLTITDHFSRFVIACEAIEHTKMHAARSVFEMAFREYGLPRAIRTDNGTPFASRGLAGLSKLSAWWMRLGITPERIEPGHPEQNGQHERMHRTLKEDTTRPAAANHLQQQERFDAWREEFNHQRPHEALDDEPPGSSYVKSERTFPERLPELEYPLHDDIRIVSSSGHVHLHHRHEHFFISEALVQQPVGIREVDGDRWLLSFCNLNLGHLNAKSTKFEPNVELQFSPPPASSTTSQKTSPMCPV